MTETFIKRNVKLSLEFDTYLAHHPDLIHLIPNGSYVVITVKGDSKFNKDSLSTVRDQKRKKIVEAHKTESGWSVRPLSLQTA